MVTSFKNCKEESEESSVPSLRRQYCLVEFLSYLFSISFLKSLASSSMGSVLRIWL